VRRLPLTALTALAVLAAALAAAGTASAAALLVVEGRGWGHGIGMSQWGARGFAAQGWTHGQILAHYYPGTRLERAPGVRVRVLLAERSSIAVGSAGPFTIRDGAGEQLDVPAGRYTIGAAMRLRLGPSRVVELTSPVRVMSKGRPLTVSGRAYRGSLLLSASKTTVSVINDVGMEQYLYGVVPREMPTAWNTEALKAQAVAARSYAHVSRRPGRLFDVYADVRSQVYEGIAADDWRAAAAIDATAGQVLKHGDAIAHTFFFSTSGGRTAAIADEWPAAKPLPYLVSVPDPHDSASPHHTWGPVAFSGAEVKERLGAAAPPRLDRVEVKRNPSGRVSTVAAVGAAQRRELSGAQLRTGLGLRSTWFTLRLLTLDGPGTVAPGSVVRLQGRVQNVKQVVLQQRQAGGGWSPVGPLRPGPDGAFATQVRPQATTQYRLAGGGAAGAVVTVTVDARRTAAAGPRTRPATAPARIPAWAWRMLEWHGRPAAQRGPRPAAAPPALPGWYWDWRLWRVSR
jgi:stage II sporulation protein D